MKRRVAIVVASVSLSGCGLQATSGAVLTGGERPQHLAISATAVVQPARKSNTTLGIRTTMVPDDGIEVKQVVLQGGYDLIGGHDVAIARKLPQGFAVAFGPELGAGGPVDDRFSGKGAYVGGIITPRIRLSGNDDYRHSFSILFTGVELVASFRGGAWLPPEGSTTKLAYSEVGFDIGLRFVIGSDIVSGAQGAPRGDELPGEKGATQ